MIFLIDSLSIFYRFLSVLNPQGGAQGGSTKGPEITFRGPFGYFLALGAVLEPGWLQDGPQLQFWSIFYGFCTIFNRFLNNFWTIFGQFLVDFLFILVDNPSIHQPINPSSPSSGTWLITQWFWLLACTLNPGTVAGYAEGNWIYVYIYIYIYVYISNCLRPPRHRALGWWIDWLMDWWIIYQNE